jgi:hypothetical protein
MGRQKRAARQWVFSESTLVRMSPRMLRALAGRLEGCRPPEQVVDHGVSPTSTVGSEFFVVFVDKPFVPGDISLSALNSDECMKYFT